MPTNAQVTLSAGSLTPGFCYPSLPQDLLNAFVAAMSAFLPGNFSTFNFGPSTPSPDDQDKPWIKTDNAGYPIGLFVYAGGLWLRPHPTPASGGQCIIWKGSEAALWAFDGGDGSNPATTAPTLTTGAMWQRDTDFGSDTTPFRFPVGIGTNPTTYDGGAATIITPGATGGAEKQLITEASLPQYDPTLAANAGTDDIWVAGNATGDTKNGVGLGAFDGGAPHNLAAVKMTSPYGSATPTSVSNMPPYLGVIFAKRTARAFYTA